MNIYAGRHHDYRLRLRIGQGVIIITLWSLLVVAGASAKGTTTITHSDGSVKECGGGGKVVQSPGPRPS